MQLSLCISENESPAIDLRFSCVPVESTKHVIKIFYVQTKDTYNNNISKFRDNWSIFMLFMAQTNTEIDGQKIFKLSHGNVINNSTTMKTKFLQQQKINK